MKTKLCFYFFIFHPQKLAAKSSRFINYIFSIALTKDNTTLPGNMLPDTEHYVKNKVSWTFLSMRTDILHFPSFFSHQCIWK